MLIEKVVRWPFLIVQVRRSSVRTADVVTWADEEVRGRGPWVRRGSKGKQEDRSIWFKNDHLGQVSREALKRKRERPANRFQTQNVALE